DVSIIDKFQLQNLLVPLQPFTNSRQPSLELTESAPNNLSVWYIDAPRFRPQPVPHQEHSSFWIVLMRLNVLTRDVGDKLLVPERLAVHDQTCLLQVMPTSKVLAAEKYS